MQVCGHCRARGGQPHVCPVDGRGCDCECNDDAQLAFVLDPDGTVRGADRYAGGRRRG